MSNVEQLYESQSWIEPFLYFTVLLFFLLAIILFALTIYSRFKRNRNEALDHKYSAMIEDVLIKVIFYDKTFKEIENEEISVDLLQDGIFRKNMMKSVIELHKNYEGIYAKKLEDFYLESRLIKDSFKKLKNPNWEIKCQGIMEVSEMNISKAFDSLVKISKKKNKILKITAINACIKLNGTNGILHLIKHKHRFDIWTQLNIIEAIKRSNTREIDGIELLLASKNKSVVSLGLKIIHTFQLSNNITFVEDLHQTSRSISIKNEAQKVLENLSIVV
ncbi:MAG: hypothetical protein ACOVO2_15660 [Emticicia sp.]|uniref:hypothetical protein n=1 Tax=Emticicia sp. TaxID=1930953 RepID=UPI003BA73528